MQSRVALTELLSRCPDFEVDETGIVWAGGSYVRRPVSVPFSGQVVMAANDWLSERTHRGSGPDRILDASEQLFTRHDPGSVGMKEIAKAAGCSRATLYRYFENREALRTAYVHRETRRLSVGDRRSDRRHR